MFSLIVLLVIIISWLSYHFIKNEKIKDIIWFVMWIFISLWIIDILSQPNYNQVGYIPYAPGEVVYEK